MSVGRLITQLRKSMASGHPDLFKEIFGQDPAPTIKRYLDKFADSTLIGLLKEFDEGRKLYAGTEYLGKDDETVLFLNGVLGHSDLLQEQVDDLSHVLQKPVVGITSAHDSALLDVATTIFGYLSFTHIMNWILKEILKTELERGYTVTLLAFGHGAVICQHALDLLEEEDVINPDLLAEKLELITFGSSSGSRPNAKHKIRREHFANEHDAVTKRGCLSWPKEEDGASNAGTVFVAPDEYGHMLREHYLIPLTTRPEVYKNSSDSSFLKHIKGKIPL